MTDNNRNKRLSKTIRFVKVWINQQGFSELIVKWWQEYKLEDDIGQN